MGVAPKLVEAGLASALLGRVLASMRARGFQRAWLSWELHDGRSAITDLGRFGLETAALLERSIFVLR
jgi:hypothetical protein